MLIYIFVNTYIYTCMHACVPADTLSANQAARNQSFKFPNSIFIFLGSKTKGSIFQSCKIADFQSSGA